MSLDVDLCQFENANTDAVLRVAKWLYEPSTERTPLSEERCKQLDLKAQAAGMPPGAAFQYCLGGTKISFPSKRHTDASFPVGEWYNFGFTRSMMILLTGKDIYYVFPEAQGEPHWVRPDWSASKKRLEEILAEIRRLEPAQIEKLSPGSSGEFLEYHLKQIEVMVETMDFVLTHANPEQFLLYWSA